MESVLKLVLISIQHGIYPHLSFVFPVANFVFTVTNHLLNVLNAMAKTEYYHNALAKKIIK
jgi:hypothetical protein